MKDREKVIEILEKAKTIIEEWIPMFEQYNTPAGIDEAIALLKEQEAKWVEDKQGEHCRLIKCSNCGLTFIVGNNIPYDEWIEDRNYCRRCGARMVKRND